MKKIESLTKEQEQLVPVYLKKWIDIGYSTEPINKENTIKSIQWLYSFGNKGPRQENSTIRNPYIWFCDSPMQIELMINLLKSFDEKSLGDNLRDNLGANLRANLRDNLGANLRANLRDNLGANLWDNLWDKLWANLWDKLWDNLRDNLWDKLWANLWDNLGANLWDNLGDNLGDNLRANLWDNLGGKKLDYEYFFSPSLESYWVGFYDFILHELFKTKLDSKEHDFYKEFSINCIDFYKNVYLIIPFENICFVSERPKEINLTERNNRNILHHQDKPSMLFKDGYAIYHMNGVSMPDWIINTPKEDLDPKEIMSIENAEQRKEAIKKIGLNRIESLLKTKIHHKHKDYQLIEFEGLYNKPYAPFLKMINPTTGEIHIEGVSHNCKTVQEALAEKWNLKLYTNPQVST